MSDTKPTQSKDEIATRIRGALRELEGVQDGDSTMDAHLLEAERALRRALRLIGAM